MPDYSKTMIYKLCCNDPTIEEIYIGSTCNFSRRKAGHKSDCNNENIRNYNLKVYKFIRDNGGFENWNMIQIEAKPVANKLEKGSLEREWIEKLKPSLNSNIPILTNEERIEKHKILTKNWYENNREKEIKRSKQYKIDNKEKIKERANEKIKCECGGNYTHGSKSRHLKLKIHTDYVETGVKKNIDTITCDCGGYYTQKHKNEHLRTKKHTDYLNSINV